MNFYKINTGLKQNRRKSIIPQGKMLFQQTKVLFYRRITGPKFPKNYFYALLRIFEFLFKFHLSVLS